MSNLTETKPFEVPWGEGGQLQGIIIEPTQMYSTYRYLHYSLYSFATVHTIFLEGLTVRPAQTRIKHW